MAAENQKNSQTSIEHNEPAIFQTDNPVYVSGQQEAVPMSIEEYLNMNGEIIYRTNGVSMRPIIKSGRDMVRIRKKTDERFRKYDTVLYIRPPHKYVLHRIVEVRDRDYVILGDNCLSKEYGIRDEDILGVLTEIIRPGRTIRADSLEMKLYERIWYCLYPVRKGIIKGLTKLHPRRKLRKLRDSINKVFNK